jgi:TIR domain
MSQKFFITHSWKDIDFARKLCNDLIANGIDGFFDERSVRPGESIPSRIERGLEECDVYIPVFSPDALKSPWCDWEINMAIMMNREGGRSHIIPLIAEKCTVPARLRHLLYVNFAGRYNAALDELLTKSFDLPPKPAPSISTPFSSVPRSVRPLPKWLLLACTVGVIVVLLCTMSYSAVGGVINNLLQTQPTRLAVDAPTIGMSTPILTSVPTFAPTATLIPTFMPTVMPENVSTEMPIIVSRTTPVVISATATSQALATMPTMILYRAPIITTPVTYPTLGPATLTISWDFPQSLRGCLKSGIIAA